MVIEIDQSGKVENTAKATYVADSLGTIVCLTASQKRIIQAKYRAIGRPRMYVYESFSALVAILIQMTFRNDQIYVVDVEYMHQDHLLRDKIRMCLRLLGIHADPDHIEFRLVGKKSPAHQSVYFAYTHAKGYSGKNVHTTVQKLLFPTKKDRVLVNA